MHPISKERQLWLDARIFILDRMIRELTSNQSRYQSSVSMRHAHPTTMAAIVNEHLQLVIEMNVLTEQLRAEDIRNAEVVKGMKQND